MSLGRMLAVCLGVVALAVPVALAEWPADPNVNLPVSCREDSQEQAKVAAAPQGGWYLSWYDNDPYGGTPYGYDVYLQLLDANGNALWPCPGVLVADRSLSWTTDYDLVVDRRGNAILAFNDYVNDQGLLWVVSYDAAGRQLWKTSLGREGGEKGTPKLAITTDHNIAVGYWDEDRLAVSMLRSNGSVLWDYLADAPKIGYYLIAGIAASERGAVIVSFTFNGLQTNIGAPVTYLMANKFAADGQPLWGRNGVTVWNAGFLERGQFPSCASDGRGGAIFVFRTIRPLADVVAQRVNSSGYTAWRKDGVPVSTEFAIGRAQPTFTVDPVTGDTIVFYIDWRQGEAICGQKFSLAGARLWGDGGLVVKPFGPESPGGLRSMRQAGEVALFWGEASPEYPPQNKLWGARVTTEGQILCQPFPVSTVNPLADLATGIDSMGMSVLAWTDGRTDIGDIYAQNVNADCTLGPAR